jgi:Orn/Lys/Arg decarboxylase, major domain
VSTVQAASRDTTSVCSEGGAGHATPGIRSIGPGRSCSNSRMCSGMPSVCSRSRSAARPGSRPAPANSASSATSPASSRLLPDPARARVRVYSTQSTHKTLTSLRQGSMIHVWDQDLSQKVEDTFHEAYITHTSTSPNYQILASLDLGRRQAALEGFELVQKQIENAMRLRDAVDNHPLLSKQMRCLMTADLIPAEYRTSGIDQPLRSGLPEMIKAWEADEFVLDPSRITIYIGATGIEGDSFKRRHLMDRYGVQINKTSRNTVLFMTTIGTSRSSVAYLIEVLVTMARELEAQIAEMSPAERAAHERAVLRLTAPSAPLPDFSAFHPSFADGREPPTPEGDVRRAFYLAYNDSYCNTSRPTRSSSASRTASRSCPPRMSPRTLPASRCWCQASCSAGRSCPSCAAWTLRRSMATGPSGATASTSERPWRSRRPPVPLRVPGRRPPRRRTAPAALIADLRRHGAAAPVQRKLNDVSV